MTQPDPSSGPQSERTEAPADAESTTAEDARQDRENEGTGDNPTDALGNDDGSS